MSFQFEDIFLSQTFSMVDGTGIVGFNVPLHTL